MAAPCYPSAISLPSRRFSRWTADATAAALKAGLALVRAWQQWRERRRVLHDLALAAELSEHTLDDIGAPDWLRAEAAAHRMAEEQRRSELLSGHAFWRHDLQRW